MARSPRGLLQESIVLQRWDDLSAEEPRAAAIAEAFVRSSEDSGVSSLPPSLPPQYMCV